MRASILRVCLALPLLLGGAAACGDDGSGLLDATADASCVGAACVDAGDAGLGPDSSDNTGDEAVFADVSPDTNGRLLIEVAVSPGGTGRFAYLGALVLTKTSE